MKRTTVLLLFFFILFGSINTKFCTKLSPLGRNPKQIKSVHKNWFVPQSKNGGKILLRNCKTQFFSFFLGWSIWSFLYMLAKFEILYTSWDNIQPFPATVNKGDYRISSSTIEIWYGIYLFALFHTVFQFLFFVFSWGFMDYSLYTLAPAVLSCLYLPFDKVLNQRKFWSINTWDT